MAWWNRIFGGGRKEAAQAKHRATVQSLSRLVNYVAARSLAARYDSLRPDPLRRPQDIRINPTETEQMFPADLRIKAYSQADDLYDNGSIGATIDTAVRLTVGTYGGKAMFTGDDRETRQREFDRWARHCGYAEGENLQDILSLILRMVKVHGDCLVLCDRDLTGGKIRLWDADQICNITDFEAWRTERGLDEHTRQVEGVVIDGTGRVLGYFVTMRRNFYAVPRDNATFLPASMCRRVSYRKKHTQYRGEPSILCNEQITRDTTELLRSEIGAAKVASEMALVVEEPEGISGSSIGGVLENIPAKDITGDGITEEDLARLEETQEGVKAFRAFEGKSAIASVPAGTKVTSLNNSARPAPSIQQWVDLLDDRNGKALGLMSCLSRGRADKSYSAGQIEVEISWQAFKADQVMLSEVVDYCLDVLMPGAEYQLQWPEAFSIDPEKDERVKDMRLRGGRMTYRQMLGADYEEQLRQLSFEKHLLEELDLTNLSFFQSASGAPMEELTPIEPDAIPEDAPEEGADNGDH